MITVPMETELPEIQAVISSAKNGIRVEFNHCYPRFSTQLTDTEAKQLALALLNHVQARS